MKTKEKNTGSIFEMIDLSKVKVDPNMKSHRFDPSVVKKVEEAKKTIAGLKNLDDFRILF